MKTLGSPVSFHQWKAGCGPSMRLQDHYLVSILSFQQLPIVLGKPRDQPNEKRTFPVAHLEGHCLPAPSQLRGQEGRGGDPRDMKDVST